MEAGDYPMNVTTVVWSVVNLLILALLVALPVWFVLKLRSVGKRLSALERRMDK